MAGKKAKALMVQGTCSGAGKSLLVAGLARVFSDMGRKVAPYKSQNMALNSYVTAEGAEIGRAQALQAQAARAEPVSDMNPVLLKASGEKGCQVILNGKVHSNMTAREYYAFRDEAWSHASAALDRLMGRSDIVVIEGAGSPAEINLADYEIVNMRVARHADCPVILVGDIERGGVFASLYGTVALLGADASLIKGFVINKFRGDMSILDPGLAMLRQLTGIGMLGVLPYRKTPGLDDEDGLALSGHKAAGGMDKLEVVIVRLNYISNFTDFDALAIEPDVALSYSTNPAQVERADVLIIPGSKNTVKDLLALREAGLDQAIVRAARNGAQVIGICGGYQMLGRKIHDPHGIESTHRSVDGIGLLDVETEYDRVKTTCRCTATTGLFGYKGTLAGYEIHMGATTGDTGLFRVRRPGQQPEAVKDGSEKGNVWGTYIHGVFDDDGFRRALLDAAMRKKGLAPAERSVGYAEFKERVIDDWASFLKAHLDMGAIMRMVE